MAHGTIYRFSFAQQEAQPHRRKSSSSHPASLSKDGGSDQYGLELLFQPDNAPPRPPSSDAAPPGREDGAAAQDGGIGKRRRAFYRVCTDTAYTLQLHVQMYMRMSMHMHVHVHVQYMYMYSWSIVPNHNFDYPFTILSIQLYIHPVHVYVQ